jgi:hypothetical protein
LVHMQPGLDLLALLLDPLLLQLGKHSSGSELGFIHKQEPGDQLSCQVLSSLALSGDTHVGGVKETLVRGYRPYRGYNTLCRVLDQGVGEARW